jgi:hypothetical protein
MSNRPEVPEFFEAIFAIPQWKILGLFFFNVPLYFFYVAASSGYNKLLIISNGNFGLTSDHWTNFAIKIVLFLHSNLWVWPIFFVLNSAFIATTLFLKKSNHFYFFLALICILQLFFCFFIQTKLLGKLLL